MTDIWSDEYTGPRWTYASKYRPFGYGTCPKGFILGSSREHQTFRHGTRDWPSRLGDEDVQAFELVLVDSCITRAG